MSVLARIPAGNACRYCWVPIPRPRRYCCAAHRDRNAAHDASVRDGRRRALERLQPGRSS